MAVKREVGSWLTIHIARRPPSVVVGNDISACTELNDDRVAQVIEGVVRDQARRGVACEAQAVGSASIAEVVSIVEHRVLDRAVKNLVEPDMGPSRNFADDIGYPDICCVSEADRMAVATIEAAEVERLNTDVADGFQRSNPCVAICGIGRNERAREFDDARSNRRDPSQFSLGTLAPLDDPLGPRRHFFDVDLLELDDVADRKLAAVRNGQRRGASFSYLG